MADWTRAGLTPREANIAEALLIATADAVRPLMARIAVLEARQSKSLADHFKGGHVVGQQYLRDDLVQRDRGTWLCLQATTDTLGSSASWRKIADIR